MFTALCTVQGPGAAGVKWVCVEPIYVTIPDNATVDTSANEPGVRRFMAISFSIISLICAIKRLRTHSRNPSSVEAPSPGYWDRGGRRSKYWQHFRRSRDNPLSHQLPNCHLLFWIDAMIESGTGYSLRIVRESVVWWWCVGTTGGDLDIMDGCGMCPAKTFRMNMNNLFYI